MIEQTEKINRIFEHYKNRLENECANEKNIRFICIEYLCQFPRINPFEMGAVLQKDGYTILFDDTSISKTENEKKERALKDILTKKEQGK